MGIWDAVLLNQNSRKLWRAERRGTFVRKHAKKVRGLVCAGSFACHLGASVVHNNAQMRVGSDPTRSRDLVPQSTTVQASVAMRERGSHGLREVSLRIKQLRTACGRV